MTRILIFLVLLVSPLQGWESETQTSQIEQRIKDLSDDDWKVRDEATRKLTSIGRPAVPFLEKAATSDDPEVAFRAKSIMASIAGWKVAIAGGGIHVVNLDNGSKTQITISGYDCHPALSPDGSKIVFVHGSQVLVVDIESDRLTHCFSGRQHSENRFPTWSPDGTKIAFISTSNDSADVCIGSLEVAASVTLKSNSLRETSLSWSPDGKSIVFAATDGGDHRSDIFVMKSDGSETKRLTDDKNDDFTPVWSPDGKKIAFASDRDRGMDQREIYVMDADGANVRRLTSIDALKGGGCRDPRWSPDGTRIAFWFHVGGNGIGGRDADGLYTIDSNLKKIGIK